VTPLAAELSPAGPGAMRLQHYRDPVGCTNSISRRLFVLVEESAEEVAPSDLPRVKACCGWRIGSTAVIRRSQVERAVWTLLVEVADIDAEDVLEVAAADDQQPVEAFPAHAADPALAVSVRVRRPDRRADDADAFALEDAVEGPAELRVSVVDQRSAGAGCGRRGPSSGSAPAAPSTPHPGCSYRRGTRPAASRSR
jgi:hypothetical protein